jgi:hypothetical protein
MTQLLTIDAKLWRKYILFAGVIFQPYLTIDMIKDKINYKSAKIIVILLGSIAFKVIIL